MSTLTYCLKYFIFTFVINVNLPIFVLNYCIRIPLCDLINNYIIQLAKKFPATKFLKSVATTCIPNYPDKNLPTVFIYYEGEMKQQFAGPLAFGGMRLTQDGKLLTT